jgi:hypothetical protein
MAYQWVQSFIMKQSAMKFKQIVTDSFFHE